MKLFSFLQSTTNITSGRHLANCTAYQNNPPTHITDVIAAQNGPPIIGSGGITRSFLLTGIVFIGSAVTNSIRYLCDLLSAFI